ncbi:glucan endo-1,3-alpha-glucosidase agn1 [Colletotrichum higginsianum IMI 349063]|uniref:Glucan endo-1,3-alpha-glucosidase agn1 n=1 Tax=Colletotrichum higginsianum (strain IMI 349063) TaxID=759273 RepID=A0A1B7XTR6_COLHI|nr:glucan endo-1,3-alpha-glucosidase agn1 [Colletotrichum higginsianum IMI 349063]XP_018152835.1 glucan endo-1,3-alpha-glucosidase agn1 [Colletotrichum higginsianum IMI 349063]OBR03155.1 glucan endo-1,3-alpha-glucosidase agn1 [Colletotrichum higginsianum IMI 349063]OBR04317.1 glucan endo-1,3-alpha-glucosidase agn1 [Colletotrichum higginsianum IMI 349063]
MLVQVEGDPAEFAEDKVFFTALLSQFVLSRARIRKDGGEWTKMAWPVTLYGGVGLYHVFVSFNSRTGMVGVENNLVGDRDIIIAVVTGPPIMTDCEHGIVTVNPGSAGPGLPALSTPAQSCPSRI